MSHLTDAAIRLGFVTPRWISETDINRVDTGTFNPSVEIIPNDPTRTLNARYGTGAGRAKGVPSGALPRHFGHIDELDNHEVRTALGLPPDYKQSKGGESFYSHILSLVQKGEEPKPQPVENPAVVEALKAILAESEALESSLPRGGGIPMQRLVREVRDYLSRVRKVIGEVK